MNRTLLTLLCPAFFLLSERIQAQTEVATDPVGFTSVVVEAGDTSALSLPLNNPPDYHGVVSTLSSNTIQTAYAGWTANAYGPFNTNPHVIRFVSGASKGRQFKVVSNTADTLTLNASNANLTTLVAAGDQYQILPVATLQSLFGPTAPALLVAADPELADNVLLRGSFGWLTYYNDGTQWLRQGAGNASQNTVPILPEQGLLLVRRSNSPVQFLVTGVAPTTNLKTDLAADAVTSLGNRFPVNLNLTQLRLNEIAGWIANADPAAADTVLIRGSFGWLTYYYNGTGWVRQGGGSTTEDPVIPLGVSVLIARGAGVNLTLDQAPPY
jgi:uncharacterized protein (TIGR02597 family)